MEIGFGRIRGWIDILAFRPVDHAALCIEIKTELHDLGRLQRTLSWYERQSWAAARRLSWRPSRLSSAVIVLLTVEVEQVIARNSEVLRQAFPARTTDLLRWLRDPTKLPGPPTMGLIDPRSRRSAFIRPTRLEGRRTAAPYRNYADAAGQLRRGG